MSTCSIAQAKDQMSKLVDEVLEGNNVTITRHGQPVVEMRPAPTLPSSNKTTIEMLDMMKRFRESIPKLDADSVVEIRAMRDEF
ncbi:type II toxin-antitoxin system prevent-host-death family antitoxin [Tardiphaga sp.]|uniref:type II toxin-antitoxin system Phd/YefM family antitoxin n=1 Tax=Tardiphaga sp. TaxID=1926292 RepID=UPI001989D8EE|nr:type II toxin-antitoxin system prevent-host-death family antitoxin [Tardiphaga sp.]MBC7579475.1 type II toxin-antitoxin system prevent-host-death family antitoxin [Tardiphaga sp.]